MEIYHLYSNILLIFIILLTNYVCIFVKTQISISDNYPNANRQSSHLIFNSSPLSPTQGSGSSDIIDRDDHVLQSKSSPPMFVNGGPPSERTVLDGRDVDIQCEATGVPLPTVEWLFNHTIAIDLTKRKYQITGNGALMITPVERSDEGIYTCVRSNKRGSINGSTNLKVIVRTHIDQPPVDSKVILSSTAEMQCRVRHDDTVPVKTQWTFSGGNITNNSRIKIMADGTLRIEQVRNTDVGIYTCRVESVGGTETRSARLDVIELPHPPTNVKAELNINGGLVNVSWSPPFDGNSPIVKYIVQMRAMVVSNGHDNIDEDIAYGVHNWVTASNISSAQNFVLLTNLRPAMTYQFRVSAVNNVGEGLPGGPTAPPITLPAQPPNAAPIGVVGAPRSSTAIMIQWQPPPPESHNGQLMGYMVRYKLAGYAEHTPWYQKDIPNPAQLSFLLDDLIVWQNYEIQIAAYNEMGVGTYSQSIFVRTKEGKPASQVRNVRSEAVNSTAIQISWQSPDPQLINGINQGYKIQAWNVRDSTSNPILSKEFVVPPVPFPEKAQTTVLDSLEPYTTYQITVLCFTSAGDGPKTDPPIIVITKQDLPSEVSNFKFKDIYDKSVRVQWDKPNRVNGELLGYTLRYYLVGSNEGQKHILNFTAQQNETVVTNLRPQTAYTFEINAWTIVGAGAVKSSTIQSSISPVLPLPPSHLAISNIGAFSVVLQFTPGFNGNASISKWIVEAQFYRLRNANYSIIYESTNHTQIDAITVYNLRPYTEYRLRLIPVNVVGRSIKESEPSPPFQTLQALPAHPPLNVTLRTVSPTAMRVRWTPLPPESWYGHPRGYNVTWRDMDAEGRNTTINWYISDDYHSHSYLITNLEEYTNYGVQVFALNDVGSSTGTHIIIQRTNEATPSTGPDSIVVKATSSTTIVVDWGEIPPVDRNGIIQGYKVKYASLKVPDNVQYKIIEGNQTRTTTLTELKKYTTYRISVCAFTHVGDGVYSKSPSEQTHQDVPGPPSNVTFPDVTLTTARIQWDIPDEPNGEILAYKVSYKMNDDYTGKMNSREFLSTDRTNRFIHLRPEMYYVFEVSAKTSEGWGKPAKVLVYTTNSRQLPSPPSQPLISVSQISSKQVTINWTPGRDGFAPLRYYTIQIASQGGPWWTYPNKIDPSLYTYTIPNLKPFTTYQFRLKATNDIGDSGWSLESPITRTLPAPPDKAPLNVVISPYSTTSVAVKWSEIFDWNGDEIGAGYKIKYCLVPQQGVQSNCPSAIVKGKNITNVSIENLERDQHYEIRVIAYNGQGDGPSSKSRVVYVGEAVPTGEPLNIEAVALSSTEVKVLWSPPAKEKQNGQIMGYKIFYWQHIEPKHKHNDDESNRLHHLNSVILDHPREMFEIVPVTCESFILLDLYKWSNYSIQISAFNPAGDGPRSKPYVIETKEDTPAEVGTLKFSEITMSQIKVIWSPPDEPNGILLGYYVTYETLIGDFSKQVKQKINDNFLVVSGLKENVLYTFRVRAETSAGVGPETIGNVTTGPQPGSPPPPTDLALTQTSTSVRLRWKNPDHRDITGYLIEAKNLNKNSIEWHPVTQLKNGRQERYELSFTHLSPSSQYTFRIMTTNDKGVSEPLYPDKLGMSVVITPQELVLRPRMPYYRESWFVILCACLSVVITIMVIAILCVRNKSYKYKKEAQKGSQDGLSDEGFGLDDNIENHYPTGFELRQHNGLITQQRRSNGTLSTTVSMAATKSPPRPSPGSITYSDDEDEDDDDIKGAGLYESSGESLTEKPSELSSSGPESESEHDDAAASSHFVSHYANVNDTLKKGQPSWKRHAKPYVVPSHHNIHMPRHPPPPPPPSYHSAVAITASEDSELECPSVNLNGGRIIVNNMAGSRAPLPGFSSFV